MKRKFLAAFLSLLLAVCCAFAFTACKENDTDDGNKTPDTEQGNTDDGTTPPAPKPEEPKPSIKFADFLAKHMDKAQDFVSNEIRPVAVDSREVLAEKWSISANKDDELTSVSFAFTYKDNDTERTVQIVNVTLENPIDLDDIVSGKANLSGNSAKSTKTTVFTFDAKETAEKQNLASALYAAHGDTSDLMLFTETLASRDTRNAYNILVEQDNQYVVKTLEVTCGDSKDATIIANLADVSKVFNKKTKNSYTLNGTNIYSSEYTLEKFEGTTIDPEKPTPTPSEVTSEEIVEALETNCKTSMVNKCLQGLSGDKNVSNEKWFITKNSDGNITKAEYTCNYQKEDGNAYFALGTITFDTPISAQNLKDGNLGNASYARTYRVNYLYDIQNDRADLTNAICDTVFGENNNATRYIVDNGDIVNHHDFKVVEITDGKVEETTVSISGTSLSDTDYINKLNNPDNYSVVAKDTYTLSGEKVSQEAQSTTA